MMFCANCGKEIDDRAVICPHCGVPVTQPPKPGKTKDRLAFGFGIAGFVVALVSLWTGVYFCITSIVAVVLSAVAMHRAKAHDDPHGLATAGLVIGIVTLVLWAIIWIALASVIGGLIGLAA